MALMADAVATKLGVAQNRSQGSVPIALRHFGLPDAAMAQEQMERQHEEAEQAAQQVELVAQQAEVSAQEAEAAVVAELALRQTISGLIKSHSIAVETNILLQELLPSERLPDLAPALPALASRSADEAPVEVIKWIEQGRVIAENGISDDDNAVSSGWTLPRIDAELAGGWQVDEVVPLPRRLLVHVLPIILVIFALPVGLFILLFNLLRGEDLRFTARAVALSGTAICIAPTFALPAMTNLG